MLELALCRERGLEELLKGLQGNVSLQTLTLMDGAIGQSVLAQLNRTLWENTSLTSLHLPDICEDSDWYGDELALEEPNEKRIRHLGMHPCVHTSTSFSEYY